MHEQKAQSFYSEDALKILKNKDKTFNIKEIFSTWPQLRETTVLLDCEVMTWAGTFQASLFLKQAEHENSSWLEDKVMPLFQRGLNLAKNQSVNEWQG